ncbi:hypothetical protein KKF34_00270 [Myxococcota bacterium]|nr:hypothetical protein [Myxococcota bacterium]MBU1495295.1 hypothetical protein [Myxococcota bacterium]
MPKGRQRYSLRKTLKPQARHWLFIVILFMVAVISAKLVLSGSGGSVSLEIKALERVYERYFETVNENAGLKKIDSAYFLALIMLETSGSEHPPRFEKHIYERIIKYRGKNGASYRSITSKKLREMDLKQIKDMASSWGPFQIMGYNAIPMKLLPEDFAGNDSIRNSMRWIMSEYGHLLRKKSYRDAFHYHNTGRKFPKNGKVMTHDPTYVDRGLRYMKYFQKKSRGVVQ